MSLRIDVDEVTAVLLADGWHAVAEVSFDVDSYEYLHEGRLIYGDGTGFRFKDETGWIAGPMSAVLAVRHTP